MSTNNVVAENLRNIRIQKGWTQEFVANQLQISQRTISRAECGCGISKRTLKMLSGLYQISIATIYNEGVQEKPKEMQVISGEMAVQLLVRNAFIQDLEKEIILRYTDVIQKEALMMRTDVERIIPEALTLKKTYTITDVIAACMLTNQRTISNIRRLAIA